MQDERYLQGDRLIESNRSRAFLSFHWLCFTLRLQRMGMTAFQRHRLSAVDTHHIFTVTKYSKEVVVRNTAETKPGAYLVSDICSRSLSALINASL